MAKVEQTSRPRMTACSPPVKWIRRTTHHEASSYRTRRRPPRGGGRGRRPSSSQRPAGGHPRPRRRRRPGSDRSGRRQADGQEHRPGVEAEGLGTEVGARQARPAARRRTARTRSWPAGRPAGRRPIGRRGSSPLRPARRGVVRPAASTRPAPTGPRKMPNLIPRNPVSAKSVGATRRQVRRQAGGQGASARWPPTGMGKAIEVIEVLEKVVASVTESPPRPT